ncbi:MAG TPA: alkaline phosphatase family protein [Candidatus Acidoferrales bacterium]|nr:alkaline phosphatase family protein [Candidatus Acidoferrales bacterium]
MKRTLLGLVVGFFVYAAGYGVAVGQSKPPGASPRNVLIFVFDGLRAGSVNAVDSPTMFWIREHGVNFTNSHSLFPTFTTANASAIATGHYLGDTGDYSNQIYIGHPVFIDGNFGRPPGSYAPYVENDRVLGDLDAQFNGNYLNEETLLAAARRSGYNTAAVGKMGPAAIQDVSQLNPVNRGFAIPQTILIDDGTGTADGMPLAPEVSAALIAAGLPTAAPSRDQPTGNNTTPGTREPNYKQQAYFADATSKVILPMFAKSGKPFALLYWSRDPDGTQHFQGDSLNQLVPGINGPTSKAALRNADNNLKQILDYVNSDPQLAANTDIFLTADHGFATISKRDIDAAGHATASYASTFTYRDAQGRQEVNTGFLPVGFVAIDLAHELGLPLYDPDSQIDAPDGKKIFARVDPSTGQQSTKVRQHPVSGNGLIGGTGLIANETDASVVIAANGGSDLIYLPKRDPDLVRKIAAFLARQDYVDGLFVDDAYKNVPGALPSSSIGLIGSSLTPTPTIAVTFKTFFTDPSQPAMTGVQITDYPLQHGQGMHGSFGRANTFNFMAAIGPDFKKQYQDPAPISNADIAPTLAQILGFDLAGNGKLRGRVLKEALQGGPASITSQYRTATSRRAANGKQTILLFQRVEKQNYFDQACFETPDAAKGRPDCFLLVISVDGGAGSGR